MPEWRERLRLPTLSPAVDSAEYMGCQPPLCEAVPSYAKDFDIQLIPSGCGPAGNSEACEGSRIGYEVFRAFYYCSAELRLADSRGRLPHVSCDGCKLNRLSAAAPRANAPSWAGSIPPAAARTARENPGRRCARWGPVEIVENFFIDDGSDFAGEASGAGVFRAER